MKTRLALPLIVLAAVGIGCSWLRDLGSTSSDATPPEANTATSSVETTSETTSSANRENPSADIDAMADKFLAQKSFRAKMRGFGDRDVTTDMEFVAPDRFRINNGPGLETIVIGKDVYLSMGDSFQKIPGAMGGNVPDIREAFNKDGRKWFSDVRYAGEETLNGKAAHVYEYKNKGEGTVGENDSKLWVGKADGLPLRLESKFRSGSMKSLVIEYEYDPNIKIEVPATK